MKDWIDLTFGAVRWQVHPHWRDCLFDNQGLRFAEWRERGAVDIVKEAPHRTVHRVQLPPATSHSQLSIYIKHYPLSDLRAYLRQAVRPAKARTEAEKALRLTELGIPTVEPLAIGESPRGESWLITRGLEDVQQLNHVVEHNLPETLLNGQPRWRFELTEALGAMLARLHDAGVRHQDLHAGNILVRIGDWAKPLLYLIDLHAATFGEVLDWAASRDNLIMLNRWFVQRSSRSDRRRFWRTYIQRRSTQREPEAVRAQARELESATWKSCLAFWRNRDRRCLTNNRYFYSLRHNQNRVWAVREMAQESLRRLLADPDAPFADPAAKILKHSRSSTVAEITLEFNGEMRPVIYKRIMATKRSDPWLHMVRPTPALRSWIAGHRLLDCGLPTARPLAVIHRRRSGLTYECYMATEKLPDAVELHKYLAGLGKCPPREQILALIDQVARLVRSLHDRQLSHRDLKAANLLISGSRLWLIDLVGVERWRKLPHSRRVQNLGRLHTSFHDHPWISRTDKLRFLRTYFRWGLLGRGDWKSWWRQIAHATANKLAKNHRRGRPVS